MDKVLFVGVGGVGSLFVKKVNEELEKINTENGPQVNSVCFVTPGDSIEETKVPCYDLNEMNAAYGRGFTSRRGVSDHREVAEELSKDIRLILQHYLDSKKD